MVGYVIRMCSDLVSGFVEMLQGNIEYILVADHVIVEHPLDPLLTLTPLTQSWFTAAVISVTAEDIYIDIITIETVAETSERF